MRFLRLLWLEFEESVRIALEQLRAHKTRAGLTTLGVVIGIVAVTLMGVAISGIDTSFDRSLSMIGNENLYVQIWPWEDPGDDWHKYRNRRPIETGYADQINRLIAESPDSRLVAAVPYVEWYKTVVYENRSIPDVHIGGTEAEFIFTNTADFAEGRFFTQMEARSAAPVVVLGSDVAEGLFDRLSPVGKEIRVGGLKLTVIGVFARQGSFLGLFSFDRRVALPLATLRKVFTEDWGTEIEVRARPGTDLELAVDELRGMVRLIRGLQPGQPDDFEINRTEMLEQQLGPTKRVIALAGIFITGLSLFVGAIGIMNITFVSVKERTREIGTRRALGAPRRAILLQFLVEAVSICLIGGVIGLGVALAGERLMLHLLPNFPVSFSPGLIALALAVSILTGLFSGFAPAWTAAGLDPAEALRHE